MNWSLTEDIVEVIVLLKLERFLHIRYLVKGFRDAKVLSELHKVFAYFAVLVDHPQRIFLPGLPSRHADSHLVYTKLDVSY